MTISIILYELKNLFSPFCSFVLVGGSIIENPSRFSLNSDIDLILCASEKNIVELLNLPLFDDYMSFKHIKILERYNILLKLETSLDIKHLRLHKQDCHYQKVHRATELQNRGCLYTTTYKLSIRLFSNNNFIYLIDQPLNKSIILWRYFNKRNDYIIKLNNINNKILIHNKRHIKLSTAADCFLISEPFYTIYQSDFYSGIVTNELFHGLVLHSEKIYLPKVNKFKERVLLYLQSKYKIESLSVDNNPLFLLNFKNKLMCDSIKNLLFEQTKKISNSI